jgi:hypothetical protein
MGIDALLLDADQSGAINYDELLHGLRVSTQYIHR